MNAMVASDGIVLVTTPDQPSLDGMHMVIGVYNEVLADERLNPYLKFLGCLITRVENDIINKSYIGLIEEEFGAYVIKPYIRKNTKLNQSASMHTRSRRQGGEGIQGSCQGDTYKGRTGIESCV